MSSVRTPGRHPAPVEALPQQLAHQAVWTYYRMKRGEDSSEGICLIYGEPPDLEVGAAAAGADGHVADVTCASTTVQALRRPLRERITPRGASDSLTEEGRGGLGSGLDEA